MAKNYKALQFNNIDYVWNYNKAKSIISSYANNNNLKKNVIYEDISKLCIISSDAVKNWFVGKNGPGEPEYVYKMADYFGVDYRCLLCELKDD